MKKETRLWTVIWTEKGRKEYGVPKKDNGIICLSEDILKFNVNKHKRGRPKMRWAMILPVFETKEEAEAYREGNVDWITVSFIFKPED